MLEAPVKTRVRKGAAAPAPRRELAEDFRERGRRLERGEETALPRRFAGVRFRVTAGVPRSTTGRVVTAVLALGVMAAIGVGLWEAHTLLVNDARLAVPASAAIGITGNEHLTRAQLLSVLGEDVDRNVLTVPLELRRAQLESLPWVEHATVMRLLPNRVRVAIVERTPVAFVRQGGRIGLVDRHGVLLDMAAGDGAAGEAGVGEAARKHYSFPVVTGIRAEEPLSTRAARMKLFETFVAELDAEPAEAGKRLSDTLSEVDLSSPEDVKALVATGGSETLVHFGDEDFLTRYKRYERNLPEWKAKYPRLASVDMRYEHDVVLEMAPGAPVPVDAAAATSIDKAAAAVSAKPPSVAALHGRAGVPGKASVAAAKPHGTAVAAAGHAAAVRPAAGAAARPVVPAHAAIPPGGHLQQAFDVHPGANGAKTNAKQAEPR